MAAVLRCSASSSDLCFVETLENRIRQENVWREKQKVPSGTRGEKGERRRGRGSEADWDRSHHDQWRGSRDGHTEDTAAAATSYF